MAILMAIFYFGEQADKYYLSDSLGNPYWKCWKKNLFTFTQALSEADRYVGEYLRQQSKGDIKYFISHEVVIDADKQEEKQA